MFIFEHRSCDTFLPHIFQFLVLLSYECFQPKFHEPKAIVGMPRIIQLCDGIMAGGQPPQTHGMSDFLCEISTQLSSFKEVRSNGMF